jgi:hypothetical protein
MPWSRRSGCRTSPITFDAPAGTSTVLRFLEEASVRSRALYRAQTEEAKRSIEAAITEAMEAFASNSTYRIPMTAFVVSASKPG